MMDPESATAETGVTDDGALFRRLKGWTVSSIEHLAEWRKDAEDAYAFYSGDQWGEAERSAFEGDGRVAPIFNLTAVNVDAVCGLEVNNRQDVKYLPRTQGDVQINELLSSAAMWVRDQAQSEDEESDAFKDTVITGLGVTETRKSSPEDISIDRRDPTECFYDKSAKKPNLVDRRYAGRIVMMDTDEAEQMFPGVAPAVLHAKWAMFGTKAKDGVERPDYPSDQVAPVGTDDNRPKKVCLVEIEWFDWEGGEKVYKQAFLGQTGILEENPLDAWAYNFMTGKRDQKRNTWYGIVRALKDPQKMINKFLATVTHILATNAKGGLLYERGVFTDQRAAEKDWSNPQKNIEVNEGALAQGRIQPRVAPPLPAGAIQLLEFAISNIRNVSGINVELLGAADRDQPASLELQRRQSAVTILASLFDGKRRYHKEQGRTLLALMKTLPAEMLVRVTIDEPPPAQPPELPPGTPPEQAQQVMAQFEQQEAGQREMFVQFGEVMQQAFTDESLKFDVIVDEAPSSPNQQQEVIAKLSMLASQGLAIPPEGQAIILRNIGLPSTVADELAKAIASQGGAENPQMMQLTQELQRTQQEAAAVRQELDGVKMDRSLDQEKIQVDRFKAGTDRMKARSDALAQTGGVPAGDQVVPIAEYLFGLEAKVDQIGEAVLHIQGVA